MQSNSLVIPGRQMSWTLFGYILKDALFAFTVSFLFYFFVFFVNQILLIAQEILSKRVPVYQVILLVLYALPQVIAMSAPFASLMGTLITIGRLSSDNEILVMLASGLSYRVVFFPALVLGIIISIFSFLANDVLLPAGTVQFQRLYRRILVSTPALELEANSVKRFRDTVIITGPVRGNAIDNLIIMDRTSDGERRVILAQAAELQDGGREGLSLDLAGSFLLSTKEVVRNDYDYAYAELLRYWVPQEDLIQAVHSIGPNQMSSVDLRREVRNMTIEHNIRMEERYARVLTQALNLEENLRAGPGSDSWNRREGNFGTFSREHQSAMSMRNNIRLLLYRLEYNKKFSIPFGALSFVLLAVSLGLLARKSGQTVGFIFGLIISVIYWALLMGGQNIGIRMGYSPFWSMWLPNVLALTSGFVLFIVRLKR